MLKTATSSEEVSYFLFLGGTNYYCVLPNITNSPLSLSPFEKVYAKIHKNIPAANAA